MLLQAIFFMCVLTADVKSTVSFIRKCRLQDWHSQNSLTNQCYWSHINVAGSQNHFLLLITCCDSCKLINLLMKCKSVLIHELGKNPIMWLIKLINGVLITSRTFVIVNLELNKLFHNHYNYLFIMKIFEWIFLNSSKLWWKKLFLSIMRKNMLGPFNSFFIFLHSDFQEFSSKKLKIKILITKKFGDRVNILKLITNC